MWDAGATIPFSDCGQCDLPRLNGVSVEREGERESPGVHLFHTVIRTICLFIAPRLFASHPSILVPFFTIFAESRPIQKVPYK